MAGRLLCTNNAKNIHFERIYQQAAGFNKEVPDSVFFESLVALLMVAADKKDKKK